eukprot:PLAT4225.1.p1 GENE.PLAT4225.1~~PLAT4225.1.p1  ORF type:complete len:380 (+),score=128.01 PLAT4225.1:13-1152(+)
MSAVVVVIVLLLLAAAAGGTVWWCRNRRQGRILQQRLLGWVEESIVPVPELARKESMDDPRVSKLSFSEYHNDAYGFTLQYPNRWSCEEPASGTVLVRFTCPSGDASYKRLSVALDDLAWTNMTLQEFADHVLSSLPRMVPGSELLHERSLGKRHEIVYRLPDEEGGYIKLLNTAYVGQRRAFTVTFSIDEHAFDEYEHTAKFLTRSLKLDSTEHVAVDETPPSAAAVEWMPFHSKRMAVSFLRPRRWSREVVNDKFTVRFQCSRGERAYKAISFFSIDLSALPSDDLLRDLAAYFEEERTKGPLARIVDRRDVPGGVQYVTVGRRGFVNSKSLERIGLHGPDRKHGHIHMFTTTPKLFDKYVDMAVMALDSLRDWDGS